MTDTIIIGVPDKNPENAIFFFLQCHRKTTFVPLHWFVICLSLNEMRHGGSQHALLPWPWTYSYRSPVGGRRVIREQPKEVKQIFRLFMGIQGQGKRWGVESRKIWRLSLCFEDIWKASLTITPLFISLIGGWQISVFMNIEFENFG